MIVNDFVEAVSKRGGFVITRKRISPKTRNVFELTGKMNCLLYLHSIDHQPYRWGVTANVLERLRKQNKPWAVVLFYESHSTGYLLSSADVEYYTKNVWPLARDGDYKPAPGSYLAKNIPFQLLDEFFAQLSTILAKPFSVETALGEAKKEAERMRKRGGGESDLHKQLKNYIADHPASIGLSGVLSVSTEYIFPTGDQVDVAFESSNNYWTVVEIELQGLAQTLVGLFQSVKYKALQDAVLRSKNLQGSVDGALVAKSIPQEVKSLAEILGIKTFEIDNRGIMP